MGVGDLSIGGGRALWLEQHDVPHCKLGGQVCVLGMVDKADGESSIVEQVGPVSADLSLGVKLVICGHTEPAGLGRPENHSVGEVTAAQCNPGQTLGLEVGPVDLSVVDGVGFASEVSNGSKGEQSSHVRLSFVEELKRGGQDVLPFRVFTIGDGDHVHAFKRGSDGPKPEALGQVGFLQEGSGHSDCGGPVTLHQAIL